MFTTLLWSFAYVSWASASQSTYPRCNSAYASSTGRSYGNITLAATGTGLPYASACNAAKQTWAVAEGTCFASSSTFRTTTSHLSYSYPTYTDTYTFLANSTPYTLCDGFTRLDGHTSTSRRVSTLTKTIDQRTFVTSTAVYQNASAPSCSIQSSDCAVLNSSYYSVYDAWTSYNRAKNSASDTATITSAPSPNEPGPPMCGAASAYSTFETVGPAACALAAASIQLLYWPVTRLSDNICNGSASTLTMGPTISGKPNTFLTLNTTLTSPTVYIQFFGNWSFTSSGNVFSDRTDFVLPQSSTAVSSLCGKVGGGYLTQAVNYADFNGPVPASAYRCQPRCVTNPLSFYYVNTTYTDGGYTLGGDTVKPSTITYELAEYSTYATENLCSTIWDDFRPALSIPPEFSTMHAYLGECQFNFDSVYSPQFYDPPKALTHADSVAGPTAPGYETTTTATTLQSPTAEPAHTHGPSTAVDTSTPRTTAEPTATAERPASSENEGAASGTTMQPTPDHPIATGYPPSPTSLVDARPTSAPQPTQDDDSSIADPPLPSTSPSIDEPPPSSHQPSPPSSTHASKADSEDNPTATTSRGIGDIIASVLGYSNSESSVGGISTSNEARPASSAVPGSASSHGAQTSLVVGDDPSSSQVLTFAVGPASATDAQDDPVSAQSTGAIMASETSEQQHVVTLNGQEMTFSPLSNGAVLENDKTTATILADSAPITIGTQTISAASSGQLVVGSSTVKILPTSRASSVGVFTFGGQTYTADAATEINIGPGTTLTPGGVVTASGTTISLDPSGTAIVVNGVTQVINLASEASSDPSTASGTLSLSTSTQGTVGPAAASQTTNAASSARRLSLAAVMAMCFALLYLLVI